MRILKFPSAKRGLGLITLAVLGTASCSLAIAQDETTGPYIGGSVGQTRAKFSNDSISNFLAGQNLAVQSATGQNNSTGFKAFGGYQFNRNLAVEGGYFDLGRSNYTFNTVPAGTFSGNTTVRGLNLDLVGIAPLTDRFSVLGRVGAAYAQSRANFASTGAVPANGSPTSRNGTDLKLGLGLQYAITEALGIRAEIERYRINDPVRNRGFINMASIGLVYRFGGKVQTPVAQAYVPPPVVAAPPPAPVYVAPPPAPVVVAPAPAPTYEPVRPAKQGRN